jgi:type I restriction enzyme R subunit
MPVPVRGRRSLSEPSPIYEASDEARLALATLIHTTVLEVRPDDFRGHVPKENEIKRALYPLLGNDIELVEKVFAIIKQQPEY